MSTAGAASRTIDLSTKKGTTSLSQFADTIPTTFEQHLNESLHRFVKSHADTFLGLLLES